MTVDLTPELLRQLLTYDPDTGKLFWRYREEGGPYCEGGRSSWNTKYAGKEALTAMNGSGQGYLHGCILGQKFKAHRVAWAIATGKWPEANIDHINRVTTDNRLANLREASKAENERNTPGRANSSSIYKGVSWHASTQKWRATITVSAKQTSLGYYAAERDAALAYNAAALEAFKDFAFLNDVGAHQ